MRSGIVIVAVLGMLLLGWISFRNPRLTPSAQPDPLEPPTAPAAIASAAPAPIPSFATTAPSVPDNRQITNLMALLLRGDSPPVTLEQLAGYLQANHRDADSLLAAFQATHERALLDEAIAKFPNDPRVAYTAWFRSPPDANDPDALKSRRQALDVLKQAAPDNALANYLSAANYFKAGQSEQAVQELQAGATKPNYNDYTQDGIQSMTEAYQAAGYSEAESKLAAITGSLLPHLAELKQAGLGLIDLAKTYQQAGDGASAQAALQMCQDLGQRLDDPKSLTLIQDLVGVAIQRKGLEALTAMAPDSNTAQGVQDQLNALLQHRDNLKAMNEVVPIEAWLQAASPQEVTAYCDRLRAFGEQTTLQWLANRYSKP